MEEDEYGKTVHFVRALFSRLFTLEKSKHPGCFQAEKGVFFMSEPNASAIPTSRAASRNRTHKLTVTAMLSAVAFLLMFIEFPIPALIPAFVKLDVSDLPELLAAFSLGCHHWQHPQKLPSDR